MVQKQSMQQRVIGLAACSIGSRLSCTAIIPKRLCGRAFAKYKQIFNCIPVDTLLVGTRYVLDLPFTLHVIFLWGGAPWGDDGECGRGVFPPVVAEGGLVLAVGVFVKLCHWPTR